MQSDLILEALVAAELLIENELSLIEDPILYQEFTQVLEKISEAIKELNSDKK